MISLDQILLLEQKVESAVAKIAQLQTENDALRKSCAELTNALSAKSEQLSTIEQDQNKIENGIIKALDRLNSIENSVLKAVDQPQQVQETAAAPENNGIAPVQNIPQYSAFQEYENTAVHAEEAAYNDTALAAPVQDFSTQEQQQSTENIQTHNNTRFSDMSQIPPVSAGQETESSENSENGLFDIF